MNKENCGLPHRLQSNPITTKIRMLPSQLENFGKSVRAKAVPKDLKDIEVKQPLRDVSQSVNATRRSVIIG